MGTVAAIQALVANARDADSCPFALRDASHPGGGDALAALTDAIRAMDEGAWDLLGASPVQLTPYGPSSELNGVDAVDAELTAAWFSTLADRLTHMGWSGTLRPLVWEDRPREDASSEPWLAATLALSGWTHRRQKVVVPPWTSDPSLVPPLVELAMTWASAVAGDLWYDAMTPVRGTPEGVRSSLADRLVATSGSTFAQVRCQTLGGERRVRFSSYGHVTLEERSADDLDVRLATLRAALLPWASRVDRTCTTGDVGPSQPSWFLEMGRDKLPRWYYPHGRHLDSHKVPDACAEQVLTGAHLAAANSLADWEVSEVADDRFLVLHPEPSRWFVPAPDGEEGTRVDPDVLSRARADFGSMILSDADQ